MNIFTTIEKEYCKEITEKKSKFIATILPIENKLEADEHIANIKKRYHDARHNCFAYRILENDIIVEKLSDDGEPSGTAGMPILNILQKHNLCNILVVVTRYFGGILLGTGGLVRAYSDSTLNVIEYSEKVTKVLGFKMVAKVQYSEYEKFKYYCHKNGVNIENTQFNEYIICYITLENNAKSKLISDFETKNIKLEDLQEFDKTFIKKCKIN